MSCEHTMLRFIQGDTWRRRFLFKQNGKPVDLNFSSGRFQIRDFETDELVAEASTFNGNLLIRPDIGAVDIEFSPEITRFIEIGNYHSDLEIIYLDNTVQSSPPIIIQVVDDVSRTEPSKKKAKQAPKMFSKMIVKKGKKVA